MSDYPPVHSYVIELCDACIAGEGEECHTPGCALWLHSVSLPIHREILTKVAPIWEGDDVIGYRLEKL